MDIKEASLVKYYYDKLTAITFDEKDIYALLILIRAISKDQEPIIWELANFVAHRERDRGEFWDVLSQTKSFFNADGIKLGDTFEVKPVFSAQEIRDSFNSLFGRLGLASLSEAAANGILLCVISLLHAAKILNKGGTEVGTLLFAYDSQDIYLFGRFSVQNMAGLTHLQVPVLQIHNDYLNPESSDLQTPNMVEIVHEGGSLRVVES
jgi:hypothetical protein